VAFGVELRHEFAIVGAGRREFFFEVFHLWTRGAAFVPSLVQVGSEHSLPRASWK
jgi:hypothetical protein